jgi:CRP-like cAMP-binding protein
MSYTALLSSISKHITLTAEEERFIQGSFIVQHVKQNEFLENPGQPTQFFTYVNSGCLMTYYSDEKGHDHVMQFATAGWWTGDLNSLLKCVPSIFSTRALADSEVLLITKIGLDTLLEKYPKFERFFRIIFQNSLVTHQERIIQGFSTSADERYQHFLEKYPTLEQFVPLKYIASYLGITPEFLSKIRRKLMEK